MSDTKPVIKKLSQGVLDLKFMKKSKEKARMQDDDEEREFLYQDQLSALHNTVDKVVLIGSHYDVMTYLPCRLSFGGMEPNIEKLNAEKLTGLYEIPKEEKCDEEEEDVDVSKEEMTEHFSTVNKTLAKKFSKRVVHDDFIVPNKRKKSSNFIKPED